MRYTAGSAAKATGVATSTITRALKSGKISGEKQEGGGWLIEPAELHRVFPPVASPQSQDSSALGSATPVSDSRNSGLERLLETLEEQIRDLREDRDNWRSQADSWQAQAERLSLLLAPPVTAPPPATAASTVAPDAPASGQGKAVGGFWRRLLGRTGAND